MDPSDDYIDDYDLADFLAGDLPDDRKDEVIERLATRHDDADLLVMAFEAFTGDAEDDDTFDLPEGFRPAA